MSPLTYIFLLPLLAALLILFIPRNFRFVIRSMALLATFVSMLIAIITFSKFVPVASGFQFEQKISWVYSLGISYHVGVDGINMGLILMGAIVSFASICVSNNIKSREKEFYILALMMAGGILG